MNKCLRITFNASFPEGFLQDVVQVHAKKCNLEGTVQLIPTDNKVRVIVCGDKDNVDKFIDLLHKGSGKIYLEDLQIEPFLKDRDYRGVFRVIE